MLVLFFCTKKSIKFIKNFLPQATIFYKNLFLSFNFALIPLSFISFFTPANPLFFGFFLAQ